MGATNECAEVQGCSRGVGGLQCLEGESEVYHALPAGPRYRGSSSSSQKQGRVILVTNLNEEVSEKSWMSVNMVVFHC